MSSKPKQINKNFVAKTLGLCKLLHCDMVCLCYHQSSNFRRKARRLLKQDPKCGKFVSTPVYSIISKSIRLFVKSLIRVVELINSCKLE